MALSNRKFVRLPPDGAGKRVGSFPVLYLEYNTGTISFSEDTDIAGALSGTTGRILEVIEFTANTGQLCILLDQPSFDSVFSVGENLLVNGTPYAAAANTGTEVYYNEVVLVSGDNPIHRQLIDERGSQYTTFADGSPRLDAFGRLKTSEPSIVGSYNFVYSSGLSDFHVDANGGSVAANTTGSFVLLQVDSTSGSYAEMTSNTYHTYLPGISMTIMQTVISGDTGKANLIRRWGYFDQFDGVFWEVSGSVLSTVIRSSANGSVVDRKIPQSAWSVDKVDGSENSKTNISKVLLDITKNNIYTIDFQWLGAGRVRFAISAGNGERVIVHEEQNANAYPLPYTSTGTLPLRYEILNDGATAGTSEMKVVCATVQADVQNYKENLQRTTFSSDSTSLNITSSVDWTYVLAGRAIQTVLGKPNRITSTINGTTAYASNPVFLQVMRGGTIAGGTWTSSYADTALEFNSDGSASGGVSVYSTIVQNTKDIQLDTVFDKNNSDTLIRKADINANPTAYWVRAKLVSGSTPSSVALAFNWTEYR